jgi:hypothetical protein
MISAIRIRHFAWLILLAAALGPRAAAAADADNGKRLAER